MSAVLNGGNGQGSIFGDFCQLQSTNWQSDFYHSESAISDTEETHGFQVKSPFVSSSELREFLKSKTSLSELPTILWIPGFSEHIASK